VPPAPVPPEAPPDPALVPPFELPAVPPVPLALPLLPPLPLAPAPLLPPAPVAPLPELPLAPAAGAFGTASSSLHVTIAGKLAAITTAIAEREHLKSIRPSRQRKLTAAHRSDKAISHAQES